MLGHLGGAPHLRRTWQWASGDKCGNAKCQGAREQQPRAFRKAYIACCCLKIFIAFLPLGLSPWSAFCWEHSYCHAHSCPNVAQGLWTHTAAPHVAMNPESPNRRETESGAGGVSDSEDFLQIKTCRDLVAGPSGNEAGSQQHRLHHLRMWLSGTSQGSARWRSDGPALSEAS